MEKRQSTKKSEFYDFDQPNRKSKDIKISFESGGSDLLEFTKNSQHRVINSNELNPFGKRKTLEIQNNKNQRPNSIRTYDRGERLQTTGNNDDRNQNTPDKWDGFQQEGDDTSQITTSVYDDMESKFEAFSLLEPVMTKDDEWLSIRQKGWLTLFSGFLWMLWNGSYFMIGPLSSFIYSYFPESKRSEVLSIFPRIVFMVVISNFCGAQLIQRRLISPRRMIIICSFIGIGGNFVNSWVTDWKIFQYSFPICYGLGIGPTIQVHMYLVWRYIPGREGLLAGLINAGNASGTFIFTYLSITMINPDNVESVKLDSTSTQKPYPLHVANNFPIVMRKLCLYWTIIAIIAIVAIQDLPKDPRQLQAIDLNRAIQKKNKQQKKDDKKQKAIEKAQQKFVNNTGAPVVIVTDEDADKTDSVNIRNGTDDNLNVIQSIRSGQTQKINEIINIMQNEKDDNRSDISIENSETYSLMSERNNQSDYWNECIEKASLGTLLCTKQFLLIYSMSIMSILFSYFIISSSKAYGEQHLGNEAFLSFTASFSGVFGIFRFIWSSLMDYYKFKTMYGILVTMQIITALILPMLMQFAEKSNATFWFYFFANCLCQFTAGGHFTLLPTVFAKLFGVDGGLRVYSVGFSFVGMGNLINSTLIQMFLNGTWGDVISYHGFCYLYGGFSIASLCVLILFFKEERVQIEQLGQK